MTQNQRRTFLVAFDGVLVASRMYVATFALLSCYERVFITKKNCIFHDFGIMDLRTTEPFRSDSRTFFSNLRTFGPKNLRTHEPSNLRTFGLIGCNQEFCTYTLTKMLVILTLNVVLSFFPFWYFVLCLLGGFPRRRYLHHTLDPL